MTTPSGSMPWQAANATDGLSWYAGQGIEQWKAQVTEGAIKKFLAFGQWALSVPLTSDLAGAIMGEGAGPDLNNDGIPDLQQVSEFLQGKFDLMADIEAAVQPIIDVFEAILKAASGDFSGMADLPRALLDRLASFFGGVPGLPAEQVWTGLEAFFSGLIPGGGLDATKLIGDLPTAVVDKLRLLISTVLDLGLLRITPSMIFGGDTDELLLAAGFDSADSMVEGDGWSWDGTVGQTSPLGSARVVADGSRKVQTSNLVRVEAGQKLPVSAWVRWASIVAGSGPGFTVELVWFNGDAVTGSPATVGTVMSPAGSGAWLQRSGTVTVPSGVDGARLRVAVEASVSSGTVWFDNASVKRTGLMGMGLIDGLLGALSNLLPIAQFQSLLNSASSILGGPSSGQTIPGLSALLGAIPKSNINGLDGALGALLPKTDWSSFLGQFKTVGNTGAPPSTGVPLLDDALGALLGVRTKAATAQTTADATAAGVVQGWAGGSTSGSDPDVYDTLAAIKSALQNGYTVQTVTSSQTWTKPAGLAELIVICVGAGQVGGTGYSGSSDPARPGGAGGLGGGYIAQALDPAAVASPVSITIGASNGAVTSFGSYVASSPGSGGIASLLGFSPTTSMPGTGGTGGNGKGTSADPTGNSGSSGASSALGVGGGGGAARTAGTAGAAVSTTVPTKCGGGGGGGGGGGNYQVGGMTGGNGAPGGFPGGGGGGGGGSGYWGVSGSAGVGGAGASGVMWIFTR